MYFFNTIVNINNNNNNKSMEKINYFVWIYTYIYIYISFNKSKLLLKREYFLLVNKNDNKRIKILKYQSMFLLTNSYLLAKFVLKLTFFYITTIIFFLLLKNLPLRCNDKHMHIYNSFIKKLLVKLCELNIYIYIRNKKLTN